MHSLSYPDEKNMLIRVSFIACLDDNTIMLYCTNIYYDRTHYMHIKIGNPYCTHQYHGGDNIKIQNKSLPLDSLLKVLKEKSGKDDVHVGNIRETLVDVFGDDVSPTVKRFVQSLKGWDNSEQKGQGKFKGLVRKVMDSQPKSQCFEKELVRTI